MVVSINVLCTLEDAVGATVMYLGYQYCSRLCSRILQKDYCCCL